MTAAPPPLETPAQICQELEKASSLVTNARRLMRCGTTVDLSALEGKVRHVCDSLARLDRDKGRPLVPDLEKLIQDLDRLAETMRDQAPPHVETGA